VVSASLETSVDGLSMRSWKSASSSVPSVDFDIPHLRWELLSKSNHARSQTFCGVVSQTGGRTSAGSFWAMCVLWRMIKRLHQPDDALNAAWSMQYFSSFDSWSPFTLMAFCVNAKLLLRRSATQLLSSVSRWSYGLMRMTFYAPAIRRMVEGH